MSKADPIHPREMGYKGTEVSKVLGIRGSSGRQCVERGKKLLTPDLI